MLQQSGRMSGRRRQLHWKIGTFFFHFRRVCALKTVLQTLKTGILRSTQYCRQRPQLKWCDGASVRKTSSFKYKTQQKRSHQMHQLLFLSVFCEVFRKTPFDADMQTSLVNGMGGPMIDFLSIRFVRVKHIWCTLTNAIEIYQKKVCFTLSICENVRR